MRDFLREHGWAVVVSVLLHGLLVGGLVLAALISAHRLPPAVHPLPTDSVVVDLQVVQQAAGAARQRADQEAARLRAAEEAKAAAAAEQLKAQEAEAKAAEDAKAAEAAKTEEQA